MSDTADVSYSTLIDSGATRSFVDRTIAEKFPQNVTELEHPIPLELFDGQPTSAGEITKTYKDTISFIDGTIQTVEFLVTRLHPTAPVVLGLPWLKQFNPDINWSDLSLAFREGNARISAALAENIVQLGNNEEIRDEALEFEEGKGNFMSLELNEWLEFADWIGWYNADFEDWKREYHVGKGNSGYSDKAYAAWEAKSEERTSKLPTYKQKRRWIYKKVGKTREEQLQKIVPPKIQHLLRATALQQQKRRTRRGIKAQGNKGKVEKWEGPNTPGKAISIIGAAAMDSLIRQGVPTYFLHIHPSIGEPSNDSEYNLRATVESPIGNSRAQAENREEEKRKHEEVEELKKHVPEQYRDFLDVFSPGEAKELPPHRPYDIKIETEGEKMPPIGKLYNMSEVELKALKEYIDDMLGKGFIRSSNSPAGAPVLFAKKKDGSLRLCVDYRALNKVTRKNRYPLPLIGNLVDQLRKAKFFTKIDLRAGYNNVRVADGHEWKTTFRTRYGAFEYLVMPFGLTNAPSAFQFFMNDIFHDMVDICVVIYLDDILIYSMDEETHTQQVRKVLERLRENHLHAKPEKCSFHTDTVEYLGVIISPKGVSMDPEKVKAITSWPAPKSVKELQSFLGFANFYRRFIDNYSGITKVLTSLLRKNTPWEWTSRCQDAFELLKQAFVQAPVLAHFSPELPIILECDASDWAIAGILSQLDPTTGEIHPVAFHTRSMIQAEMNYNIYDKELLAIVECLKVWRAYCEGSRFQIQVYSDHNNLQYFTTTKQLSARQARWSEAISGYDFRINYRPGTLGAKPDALTRRSDVYPKKGVERDSARAGREQVLIPPEKLNANLIMNEDLLVERIRKTPLDKYAQSILETIHKGKGPEYSHANGLLRRNGRIYAPDNGTLRQDIITAYHDHPLRGHPSEKRMRKLVNQIFYWPNSGRDIHRYVQSCHACMRSKARRRKPYGNLKPLPIGQRPWSSISMDHIVQLPEAGEEKYDAILVVVDRLTKQAIYIPCHTTDDARAFTQLFINHVFSKHGLPSDIISDRGTLFVSEFWKELCKALGIESKLSTAYHPQTDGQTERVNQSLESYLRIYASYEQDNWDLLLPIAEFVYNNSPHTATVNASRSLGV